MYKIKSSLVGVLGASLLLSMAIPGGALAQEDGGQSVVAVLDIRLDNVTLSKAAVERMNEYLASCVVGGPYLVVPRDQVTRALVQQKVKAHEPCYGSCQISLAGAVAANKVLEGKMMRVGKKCSITLNLYDVEMEALEKATTVKDLTCDESGLMFGIERAVAQLTGRSANRQGSLLGNEPDDAGKPASDLGTGSQAASITGQKIAERLIASQALKRFNSKKGTLEQCVFESGEALPFSARANVEIESSGRVANVRLSGGGAAQECLESVIRSITFDEFNGPNIEVPYTISVR